MRVLVSVVAVALGALSCARAIRVEQREQAVDTGQRIGFQADGPRRWDFGDGTSAEGRSVEHAFATAGRYDVRGFDGRALADRISVLVQPRQVFRAIAPGAEAALVFRTLDDVAPSVDFVERLGSAGPVQASLERAPVLAFLLEPGEGARALDRAEGAGLYVPAGASALVSFFGVTDEALALRAFRAFLEERGWQRDRDARAGALVAGPTRAELFADRGVVYFVTSTNEAQVAWAADAVRDAPGRGLESEPAAAHALAELASGGVALFVRAAAFARAGRNVRPGRWSFFVGALRFAGDEGRLVARLLADRPLWSTPPPSRPERLLAHAPEGLIAAFAMDVPLPEVLDALGLSPLDGGDDDEEVRAGLEVLSRRFELAVSFDLRAFLEATLRGGGRPAPRVTLLGEAAVPDRAAVSRVLERALARARAPVEVAREKAFTVWRSEVEGHPLELALGPDTLFLRLGRPLSGVAPVDLVAALARRVEGACGPGHLTALVDLGALKRQLLDPVLIPGVDPRRQLAAQALTATFVSQLTAIDEVLVDLAPSPTGATLQVELRLSKRESRE